MTGFIDARVTVRFGVAGPACAVLVEAGQAVPVGFVVRGFALAAPDHAPGCACCVARGAFAEALRLLFLERARGEVAFFHVVCVVASAASEPALRAALPDDPMLAAWFRLEGSSG